MKVGVLQYDVKWLDKQANFNTIEKYLRQHSQLDLIVLPEMFDTGYIMNPNEVEHLDHHISVDFMKKLSVEHQCCIIGSIPVFDDGHYYNRAYAVAGGAILSQYDKKHLFAPAGEAEVYSAGSEKAVFKYMDFRVNLFICYDLRFPYWTYNQEGCDILIFSANWPKTRIGQWTALLKARAIENQAYVIACNRIGYDKNGYEYNGQSQVYGFDGSDLAQALENSGITTADLSLNDLQAYRKKLPFLQDSLSYTIE